MALFLQGDVRPDRHLLSRKASAAIAVIRGGRCGAGSVKQTQCKRQRLIDPRHEEVVGPLVAWYTQSAYVVE
jgi:hypothetical protein